MSRRGVTALELVVALAITGLTAGIGSATLGWLSDNRDRLRDVATRTERAAAVRRTLIEWLEGAHGVMSPYSGNTIAVFQLLNIDEAGHKADQLFFTTSAPTPLGTGETVVRLYVDSDDRTPERGLVAELTAGPGAPSMHIQLDSTVAELDVRCLTDQLGSRRWLPNWTSTQLVPRGIELRLRPRRDAELDPLLRLPIRVAIEAGV